VPGVVSTEGGNFALYMPTTIQFFGASHAGANYGVVFTFYSVFVVINITILSRCNVSFDSASFVLSMATLCGFLNLVLLSRHAARVRDLRGDTSKIR
jgi:hypothetical protein